jgi:RHS repeat-associated protein
MGDDTYGYAYDPLGNRTVTTENLETTEYVANNLNQYTNILCVPASLRLNDAGGEETQRRRGAETERRGAGGVGGLLAVTTVSAADPQPVIHFPMFDANGNVTEYVATNGTVAARYAYDAFGDTVAQSGPLAESFTHRFSTKPFDAETGLVMYQLRPYEPGLGRWITRDPIEEQGGLNLCGFVGNNPILYIDKDGRDFIAVGLRSLNSAFAQSNFARSFGLPLNHSSVEYYRTAKPPSCYKQGWTFKRDRGIYGTEANVGNVELLSVSRPFGHFERIYVTLGLSSYGGSYIQQWAWDSISTISFNTSEPEELLIVWNEKSGEWHRGANAIWARLRRLAQNYPYAEFPWPPANGQLGKWPNSKYQVLGNNCNVFSRYLVSVIGGDEAFSKWRHRLPGSNRSPSSVPNPGYTPAMRMP